MGPLKPGEVHLNRFEGRLLPRHSDPQRQEIPAFLVPRVTLPVQPSPVRLFSSPTNVFQVLGDGSPAASRNRNESTVLLGRSAFDGSLQGGSSYLNKKAGNSPVDFRLRHKLEEKLPPPLTECDVFGGRAGFSCNESTALTAEDGDAVVSPPLLFPGPLFSLHRNARVHRGFPASSVCSQGRRRNSLGGGTLSHRQGEQS